MYFTDADKQPVNPQDVQQQPGEQQEQNVIQPGQEQDQQGQPPIGDTNVIAPPDNQVSVL